MLNWINWAFKEVPLCYRHYRTSFDIAEPTANFIEGTALEALCSPWKNEYKIALSSEQ